MSTPSTAPADATTGPADQDLPDLDTVPGADVDRPGSELAIRHCDAPAALVDMVRLAEQLAQSDILPRHLRRQPANVLAIMFAARALDIPVWTAFQALYLIDGKVGMDATFQRALIVRAGHKFRVIDRSEDRAVVEIIRHDDPDHPRVSEFTWADAVDAGLARKDVWQKYPKAMLIARVTTQAIRDDCPEVLFTSSYAPEELDMTLDPVTGTPVTVIPSERVTDPATVAHAAARRSAEDAAGARARYRRLIDRAGTEDDLRDVWRAAHADGVLAAPLDDGVPVGQAITDRLGELRIAAAARATLIDGGLEPIDADVVEPDEADLY